MEDLKKEVVGKDVVLRSCWNCNPAHKHLKDSPFVIYCFLCGKRYYKGHDLSEGALL